MLDNLVCPISNVRIDRNVVRTNGLITTGLLVLYVLTRSPLIIVPIGLDYVLRARMAGPTSPMAHLARGVAKTLGIPYRAMDKAPKVFASRIGVCFAMGAAITHFVAPEVAPWLAGTLAVFTALESIADLCVGCVVYTYIALPLYRARKAVTSIPLFSGLDEPTLAEVVSGFTSVEFPKGTRILAEGEVGGEMFVIQAGEVQVYRTADGQETVLAIRRAGEHLGELALLSGEPRNASVRTVEAVRALRLLRSDFEQVLQRHPAMREVLERTAAERVAAEGV